jgi:molybdate transport system ATP-binding protein
MGADAALTSSSRRAVLRVEVSQRLSAHLTVAPVLDAALERGSLLVLFGPSAAGKTTIVRQIAGLERSATGVIQFDGTTWCDTAAGIWLPPQQRRVGLVSQSATLFPHLTVRDNVAYGTKDGNPRADEMASLLGLEPLLTRMPGALSGGEAQRVALARALARDPALVLLDEPFAALDGPARLRLRRDVRELLQRTETPGLLVTHDRGDAMSMGDVIAVVIGGRIRQIGPTAEVFSRPADVEVAASLGVETVLPARVRSSQQGLLEVEVDRRVIYVAERSPDAEPGSTLVGSAVYACIRAEDVTLETGAASTASASTRNRLTARVIAIAPEGPVDRVSLDCGFRLDALITRRSRDDLQLAIGVEVTAAIKATSIHLVPRL